MNIEQRYRHAPTVRAFETDRHEAVAERLNEIRVAGHPDFAGDFRMRRVGNVHDPQRVNASEGDDINKVGIEARGIKALAAAQQDLPQLEDAFRSGRARVGQMKRFQPGRPGCAAVDGRFGNRGEDGAVPVQLELVVHAARGGDGRNLVHRTVRRRDVKAMHDGTPIIVRGRYGDEQKNVRGGNDVAGAGEPKVVFGDGRLGKAEIK